MYNQNISVDQTVVYYVPSIPSIQTLGRYNHAACVAALSNDAHLLVHEKPPADLAESFSSVTVINSSTPLGKIRDAHKMIKKQVSHTNNATLITSFHYIPAVVGYLSNVTWVVDVFDDPHQYRLNHPHTHHEITSRLLQLLIGRADRQVYSIHPATPDLVGTDKRFNISGDGCPVNLVEPATSQKDDCLRGIWAGSPRLDRGMQPLINALTNIDPDRQVHIDVYGGQYKNAKNYAKGTPAADHLTFYGSTDHDEILEKLSHADFGLCVLPNRRDWHHSVTVKTREYLASGTIPVVSNFLGLRLIAEDAAVYVKPTGEQLAEAIEYLSTLSEDALSELKDSSRKRAEQIPMETGTPLWFRKCLGIEGFGGEFR